MLFYSMLLYTTLLAWNLWIGMLCYTVLCNAIMLYHIIDFYFVGLCCAMLPDTIGSPLLVLYFEMRFYGMLCYATLLYITT